MKSAEELIKNIDLPNKEWKKEEHRKMAVFYVSKLQEMGMSDIDSACLVADLYWDAFDEACS